MRTKSAVSLSESQMQGTSQARCSSYPYRKTPIYPCTDWVYHTTPWSNQQWQWEANLMHDHMNIGHKYYTTKYSLNQKTPHKDTSAESKTQVINNNSCWCNSIWGNCIRKATAHLDFDAEFWLLPVASSTRCTELVIDHLLSNNTTWTTLTGMTSTRNINCWCWEQQHSFRKWWWILNIP